MQHPLTNKYHKVVLPPHTFGKKNDTKQATHSANAQPDAENQTAQPPWRCLANKIQHHWLTLLNDEARIGRFSGHIAVLLLSALAIAVSQIEFPKGQLQTLKPFELNTMQTTATSSVEVETATDAPPLTLPSQLNTPREGIFSKAVVPNTIVPENYRAKLQDYTVQTGDTVYAIAYQFDLAPETILWSNPNLEDNPHRLSIGQEITILPTDGVYHQVGGSDTIEGIASTYKTDPEIIIDYPLNDLDPANPIIVPGQWIVVPGGSKPFVPTAVRSLVDYSSASAAPTNAPVGSGVFGWPISGRISQGYYGYHPAIDIESPVGTPIRNIDTGYVAAAGWDNSGYGYHVVIDHGNGLQSMYAHLQSYYVDAGEVVQKGQTIGDVGMTGRSSGPHLHLEIRQGSIQLNPMGFLP